MFTRSSSFSMPPSLPSKQPGSIRALSGNRFSKQEVLPYLKLDNTSRLSEEARTKANNLSQPRWDMSRGAIPVVFRGARLGQDALFLEACQAWSDASQHVLHYQPANTLLGRGIQVRLIRDPLPENPFEVGEAQLQLGPQGFIEQATIVLVQYPAIDQQLNLNQQHLRLKATLLHELGHAMGLKHHQDMDAVMHYRGWLNTRLSLSDQEAIRALYPL
jgi:Matrixin